jgi:hypothetical protein
MVVYAEFYLLCCCLLSCYENIYYIERMRYVVLFFLIFSTVSVTAQDSASNKILVAKSKKTGRSYGIAPTGEVTVTTMNNSLTMKGGLAILNDSTLVVGGKSISVNSLSSVKISKKGPKVFGGILIGLGVVGVIFGVGAKSFASNFANETLLYALYNSVGNVYLVAGSVVGISGLLVATAKKRYYSTAYDFHIKTL